MKPHSKSPNRGVDIASIRLLQEERHSNAMLQDGTEGSIGNSISDLVAAVRQTTRTDAWKQRRSDRVLSAKQATAAPTNSVRSCGSCR